MSLLDSKLKAADDLRTAQVEKLEDECAGLRNQIDNYDSVHSYQYSTAGEDNYRLKQMYQDLEREHQDIQSTYDRDKALWEGKCQFLEGQKEQYKRDLVESQKKFEMTLE